jgi:glycerate-2-kinase
VKEMQEMIKNKLFIPVVALAIVGVLGASYTMTHSGPTTANAQTSVTKNSVQADKEIKDDVVSPQPSHIVQQKADTNENDKADTNDSTKEVEDGN